jgi:hypothetical protein
MILIFQPPYQTHWDAIDYTKQVSLENDINYFNDWELGYWMEYKGMPTPSKGGGANPKYDSLPKPFVALTYEDLNQCNLDKNYFIKEGLVLKVYECI